MESAPDEPNEFKDNDDEVLEEKDDDSDEVKGLSIDDLRALYLQLSDAMQKHQVTMGFLSQRRTPDEATALVTLAQRNVDTARGKLLELQRAVSDTMGSSDTSSAASLEETVKQYHELRQLWRERRVALSMVLDSVAGEGGIAEVAENAGLSEPSNYTLDSTAVPLPRGFT